MVTPTAKHLEGLISMYQDLKRTMKITHSAIELLNLQDIDNDLLQTYWSESLNIYARPFKDGIRHLKLKLSSDIFLGIEGAHESHRYFISQRDKLIAHSVNPFEQVYVGVFLDNEWQIIGTGELASKLVTTSMEGFRDLNQLSKVATDYLEKEIEKYKSRLQIEASQMSLADLKKLEIVKFVAPGPSEASKNR
jgi:hypothetical protein